MRWRCSTNHSSHAELVLNASRANRRNLKRIDATGRIDKMQMELTMYLYHGLLDCPLHNWVGGLVVFFRTKTTAPRRRRSQGHNTSFRIFFSEASHNDSPFFQSLLCSDNLFSSWRTSCGTLPRQRIFSILSIFATPPPAGVFALLFDSTRGLPHLLNWKTSGPKIIVWDNSTVVCILCVYIPSSVNPPAIRRSYALGNYRLLTGEICWLTSAA